MARLIVILVLLIGLSMAAMAVMREFNKLLAAQGPVTDEDGQMPKFVPKMAYVALLVLMFMAASGALGGV